MKPEDDKDCAEQFQKDAKILTERREHCTSEVKRKQSNKYNNVFFLYCQILYFEMRKILFSNFWNDKLTQELRKAR